MTTEPNNPEINESDELISMWFDSLPGETGLNKPLDEKKLRRTAELQLVHSLLLQLSDHNQLAKEHQIQKLMEHIENDNKKPTGKQKTIPATLHRFARPLIRYGIAAVLIIAITFMITHSPTNTATAAIDQIIIAIDKAGDRTYSIIIEGKRDVPPPQPDRHPERKKRPPERAELDGATLYLRGNNQFVLYRKSPSDKTVINGSDGQTRWMIRPDKPVMVSNDPRAFGIPMPEELAAILSLDFKATLQQIRDHYEVKYLDNVADNPDPDSPWSYLDARKVSREFPGPKNIEIWAHPQTGLLQRIKFADIRLQGRPELNNLIIDLTNHSPLPEDWFTRQAHHSPDAEVDFLNDN